jgi:16S rRNA G1207 methylase RsmC
VDPIVLSGADDAPPVAFRGGAVAFKSPHGLSRLDALLVDSLPKSSTGRLLAGFDSEGAVALAAAATLPDVSVVWTHLDAYVGAKARENAARNGLLERVAIRVEADPPGFTARGAPAEAPFDRAHAPFPAKGESLLNLERAEQLHDVLAVGGTLVAATDGDPTRLKELLKDVFGRADVDRREDYGGVVRAVRTKERAAWKEHAHVLTVDAAERVLEIETRPGTFSYGRLDRGTKALMRSPHNRLAPNARVLDVGCGHGVLGLAALLRAPKGSATLVDSNARAVDLARRNAARNGLDRAEVLLRADLEGLPEAAFDVALANPPYFGDYRIARSFVRAARAALRRGGELRLVVKAIEPHVEIVGARFDEVKVHRDGDYGIVVGRVA